MADLIEELAKWLPNEFYTMTRKEKEQWLDLAMQTPGFPPALKSMKILKDILRYQEKYARTGADWLRGQTQSSRRFRDIEAIKRNGGFSAGMDPSKMTDQQLRVLIQDRYKTAQKLRARQEANETARKTAKQESINLMRAFKKFQKDFAAEVGIQLAAMVIASYAEMLQVMDEIADTLLAFQTAEIRKLFNQARVGGIVGMYDNIIKEMAVDGMRVIARGTDLWPPEMNRNDMQVTLANWSLKTAQQGIYEALEAAFEESWAGLSYDQFPDEYRQNIRNRLGEIQQRNLIPITGGGVNTWSISFDLEELFGGTEEFAEAFHYGALLATGGSAPKARMTLPFRGQKLWNPVGGSIKVQGQSAVRPEEVKQYGREKAEEMARIRALNNNKYHNERGDVKRYHYWKALWSGSRMSYGSKMATVDKETGKKTGAMTNLRNSTLTRIDRHIAKLEAQASSIEDEIYGLKRSSPTARASARVREAGGLFQASGQGAYEWRAHASKKMRDMARLNFSRETNIQIGLLRKVDPVRESMFQRGEKIAHLTRVRAKIQALGQFKAEVKATKRANVHKGPLYGKKIPAGAKEATIKARVAYWESIHKAPEWVILEFGQMRWNPTSAPQGLTVRIAKLLDFYVGRRVEDIVDYFIWSLMGLKYNRGSTGSKWTVDNAVWASTIFGMPLKKGQFVKNDMVSKYLTNAETTEITLRQMQADAERRVEKLVSELRMLNRPVNDAMNHPLLRELVRVEGLLRYRQTKDYSKSFVDQAEILEKLAAKQSRGHGKVTVVKDKKAVNAAFKSPPIKKAPKVVIRKITGPNRAMFKMFEDNPQMARKIYGRVRPPRLPSAYHPGLGYQNPAHGTPAYRTHLTERYKTDPFAPIPLKGGRDRLGIPAEYSELSRSEKISYVNKMHRYVTYANKHGSAKAYKYFSRWVPGFYDHVDVPDTSRGPVSRRKLGTEFDARKERLYSRIRHFMALNFRHVEGTKGWLLHYDMAVFQELWSNAGERAIWRAWNKTASSKKAYASVHEEALAYNKYRNTWITKHPLAAKSKKMKKR